MLTPKAGDSQGADLQANKESRNLSQHRGLLIIETQVEVPVWGSGRGGLERTKVEEDKIPRDPISEINYKNKKQQRI